MRKAFRHTGVLMMLGVVALGLVGAAYTLWYENLTLTANVSTGTLDADWSCEEFQTTGGGPNVDGPSAGGVDNDTDCAGAFRPVWADGTNPTAPVWNQFTEVLASKAPTCGAAITTANIDANPSSAVGDAHQLALTLGGLYPYSGCQFSIDVHSDGSVPLHFAVTSATFTSDSVPNALALWDALEIDDIAPNADSAQCDALWDAIGAKLASPGPTPVPILVSGQPLQLHFSDELVCNFTVWLQQENVEGLSGTLTATIQAHQWNESANSTAP